MTTSRPPTGRGQAPRVLVLHNSRDHSAPEATAELRAPVPALDAVPADPPSAAESDPSPALPTVSLAEPDLERMVRPRYLSAPRAITPEGVRAVAEALSRAEFTVSVVDIADDVDRVMSAVVVEKPAFVFNLISEFEANPTQAALVPSLLDLLGVTYTGSTPLALATCQNRARAHLVLGDAEIPVPGHRVVRDLSALPNTSELRFPTIATSAFADDYASAGRDHLLGSSEQLAARIAALTEDDLPILVEEYFDARRIHALVLGNQLLEVLPLIETKGDRTVLARLGRNNATRLHQLARRAFRALDCRDFAQIDFHFDRTGHPHVVDVRAMIDFDQGSPLCAAAEGSGRSFRDTIIEIARITCARTGIAVPVDLTASSGAAPDAGAEDQLAAAAD